MANPVKVSDLFDPLGPGAQDLIEFASAIQSLSRNYKAFAKNLKGDGERVKAILAAISVQGNQLGQQAAQFTELNQQERVSMAQLAVEAAKLATEQQRLQVVQQAQVKAQRQVKDATQLARDEYRALRNELQAAFDAKDTARTEKAATAILQAKNATLGLSAALRGSNSELTAARGSYNALDAENKKLIASLKALGGGIAGSSEEAQQLERQITTNTEALKAFDAKILVFNRNVGNYAGGFAGLVAELAKARAAQAGMTEGTTAYINQQSVVRGFQTAAQKSAAQMGLSYEQAGDKIEGVTAAIQPLATNLVRLEREQDAVAASVGRESEAYRKLGFQIESTKKEIGDVATASTTAATTSNDFTQQLGFTREGLVQYGAQLAAGTIGVQALVEGNKAFFNLNKEYSADLAAVRKTTGFTADEADRLGENLKELSTPTTLKGLLTISEIGGQLGESKDGILEFTKAVDVGVQALGNDFAGGAGEIATKLGKVSNVFRKELGPDTAQNILAIGSAVNQLGADGAATAPFLVDVALRTGQASAQFGLGLKNALAYAAVLEENGSTAEVAGTALNRLYSTLGNKTKEAYEIAKKANPALTLKEFTHLVNTDFNQAIQVFLKGLNAGNATTTEVSKRLGTLKLQSGEAKSAILALAANTELFATRQATANEQLRDATSLAAEAAINNDTLSGSVDKLTNDTKNFVTSGAAAGFLKFFVDLTRLLYSNTIGATVRSIGDGIDYLKEKAGLTEKPLVNYAAATLSATLALTKQAAAQQRLLDAYKQLEGLPSRTGAQELALSNLRKQLGSADIATIQAGIDKQKELAATNKANLEQALAGLNTAIETSSLRAAKAQDALAAQTIGKTAAQVAAIREAAAAQLKSGNRTAVDGNTGAVIPQAQINAANRLTEAERALAEAQRNRANVLEALKKLGAGDVQQKTDATDAAEEQEAAEVQLDRTTQERAKNRAQNLRDELADNQKRIEGVKKYQAAQGQLFANQQITSGIFAESVAGSQDLITQYERDGTAVRIKIAKAEAEEKLAVAENDRIRQEQKKKITQAEINDIEGQAFERREEIAKQFKRAVAKIKEEAGDRQGAVEELEFKITPLDLTKFNQEQAKALRAYQDGLEKIKNAELARDSELTGALARREITASQYDARQRANRKKANDDVLALDKQFHVANLEDHKKANQDALDDTAASVAKQLETISKIGAYTQEVAGAAFAIKGNFIEAEIQRTQEAYEREQKAAGDNAELKAQIQAKYDKQLRKLNYDKAKAERDQAAISVAISTAVAIAKAFAEYVFPYALIPAGIALASGLLQEAVILSKPLPSYYVGRQDGPAEIANLAERGPEIVGQPGSFRVVAQQAVGYLAKGDRVFTAPETRQLLAENELVEGRLVRRAHEADADRQTGRLRQGAARQQAQLVAAQQQASHELVGEMRAVRRAVEQQEYYRLNEQDDLVRRSQQGQVQRDNVNRRYRRNAND